jgi:hypothetical protein
MKLTLHEGIGRFSLAYLPEAKGATPRPLLVWKDPRTSSVSLAIENKVHRLGDDNEFREAVEKTTSGGRFTWKSPLVSVTEDFSFVSSVGSPQADGVRIELVIRNLTEQELGVGVRYLFDTYLGEASYVHFRTDRIAEIPRELTLTRQNNPQYWVSPLVGDPNGLGLMCMLSGQGITTPDRVLFANWKRLSDAAWNYETSPARTFSLLPYSVNDSAVAQYIDPQRIAKGSELRVVTVLGRYSKGGFVLQSPSGQTAEGTSSEQASPTTGGSAAAPGAKEPLPSVRADVSALDELLARLNRGLADGVSDEELAKLDAAVAELKERAGRLAPAPGK